MSRRSGQSKTVWTYGVAAFSTHALDVLTVETLNEPERWNSHVTSFSTLTTPWLLGLFDYKSLAKRLCEGPKRIPDMP